MRDQLARFPHGLLGGVGTQARSRLVGLVPGDPGGGAFAAMMASAKASIAAGLVAVSRAAATASSGAPARPLLKCSAVLEWREAANSASMSCVLLPIRNSDAGSQVE